MPKLPKLDFLYFNRKLSEETFLNIREIYYAETDWDERHFENYVETCSFEKLIYLMIYIHKDKYPRGKFSSIISTDSVDNNLLSYTNENKRKVTENLSIYRNFDRKDVSKMNIQYHNEEYTDDEVIDKFWTGEYYIQNLFLEFIEEVPIHIIDKALEGKEYHKTQKDNVLFYEVKDSPIKTLEVTQNSIKLNINEDKVVLYIPLW